jgi:hypothetical protein
MSGGSLAETRRSPSPRACTWDRTARPRRLGRRAPEPSAPPDLTPSRQSLERSATSSAPPPETVAGSRRSPSRSVATCVDPSVPFGEGTLPRIDLLPISAPTLAPDPNPALTAAPIRPDGPVLQQPHSRRIPRSRPTGGRRGRPRNSAGPAAAARPARVPAAARERGHLDRPADRRGLGTDAPEDRRRLAAELRLAAEKGDRCGADRLPARRICPTRRPGAIRPDALRAAHR